MDLSLGILIKVVKDQLTGWAQAAKASLDRLGQGGVAAGKAADAGSARAASAVKKVGEEAKRSADQVKDLSSYLNRLFAALSAGFTIKSFADAADAMNNLDARLRIATGSVDGANAAFEAVRATANATGSEMASLGSLYARLTQATKTLGASQAEIAQLTDTIAKGFAVSGATSQEASAAMLQLSQAFASGTLRGEELNAVLEQAPRLAAAIADGLGVTVGQLRALGAEGRLTSEQIFRAIQSQRDVIEREFATLPDTIGRAAATVANEWQVFVHELDKGTGASATAASALRALAENMDTLVGAVEHAAAAIGASLGVAAAVDLVNFAKSAGTARGALGALLEQIDKIPRVVKISLVVGGFVAAMEAAAAAGDALGKSLAKIAGTDLESATKRLEGTFRVFAAQAQEAVNALDQYKNVTILTADEVAKLDAEERKKYEAQIDGAKRYANAMLELQKWNRQLGQEDAAQTAAAQKRLGDIEKAYAGIGTAAKFTKEQIAEMMSVNAAKLVADFQALRAAGKDTETAMKGLMQAFAPNNLQSVRDFGQGLGELFVTGQISAREFEDAWTQALKGLDGRQLEQFRAVAAAAFGETKRDLASMAQLVDISLRQALEGAGVDADKAFTGMSKKAADAISNVQVLIDNTDRLKAKSKDAGAVLQEAFANAIKEGDTPAALEAIGRQLDQVGQKGLIAKDKVEELRKALGQRIAEITPGIQTLEEAFEKLGIKSQEALRKAAEEANQAYVAVRNLGGSLEDQKAAWLAYAERAVTANKGVADTGLKAESAVLGLSKELAKIAGQSEQARKAAETLRDGWDKQSRIAERNTEAVRQQGTAMVAAAQQALENAKAQGDLLAVEEATVNVRQAEAKAARELAEALEAEAAAAWSNVAAMKEKAAADREVSEAEQEIIDSATQAAEALTAQATAAQNAADKADAASKAATEKKEEVRTATIDWEGLAASYGLAADKGSELAQVQAAIWAGMQKVYSTGFGNLDNYIDAMNRAAAQAAQYIKALDGVEEAARGGDESLTEYIRALRRAIAAGQLLGDEELRPLRDALQDAKERMQGLSDSARDTLNSLRDELDSMNQNYDAIERRRFEARKAEIEAQIAIAKAAGNSQAVADLTKALTLLRQVSAERIKEAEAREREDARKLKGTSGSASLLPTGEGSGAGATPVKIVDINIKVGDQTGTVKAVEGSEEVLVDMLRQAQMVAS